MQYKKLKILYTFLLPIYNNVLWKRKLDDTNEAHFFSCLIIII